MAKIPNENKEPEAVAPAMSENKEKILNIRAPSDEETDWVKYGRGLLQGSATVVDDEAKALVALSSSLLAIYTGALTFFKIPDNSGWSFWTKVVVFLIPIGLWLISIGSNVWVYFPGKYKINPSFPNETKSELKRISEEKYDKLKIGGVFFALALAWSAMSIGYVSILPAPAPSNPVPQEVQFVVPKEQVLIFQNMSIGFDDGTMKTVSLMLLNNTSSTYIVSLQDGRKVEFKKDLVSGIIYAGTKINSKLSHKSL